MWIRIGFALLIVVVVLGIAVGTIVAKSDSSKTPTTDLAAATATTAHASTTKSTTTTTVAPTTTTTIPPLAQPAPAALPPVPGGAVKIGSSSPEIAAYEQRLVDLHFDPGPVDGKFDSKTRYAVQAVDKIEGWPRDGVITQQMVDTLANFQYPAPLKPDSEADRVEIDLDKQVLTLYKGYQVALDHHDVHRQRSQVLRRRRRLPVRDHAGRSLQVPVARQRLARRQPRPPLQPVVLQRWHRGARIHGCPDQPRVARLRADPDAHRRVLRDARVQGHVGLRARDPGRTVGWAVAAEQPDDDEADGAARDRTAHRPADGTADCPAHRAADDPDDSCADDHDHDDDRAAPPGRST